MTVELQSRSDLVNQILSEAEPVIEANESAAMAQGQEIDAPAKPEEQAKVQEPAAQEAVQEQKQGESNSELIAKFLRREAGYRQKTDTLKNENSMLKNKLESLEKRFEDLEKNPIDYFENKNPSLYERWTEKKLGMPREPMDELKEKLSSLEQENKSLQEKFMAKLQEFENKSKNTEIQNLIGRYQTSVQEAAQGTDYKVARDFYSAKGLNIVSEAMEFANAYAERYQKGISPSEAVKAVSDYAKREIDVMRKFLSAAEPTKADVKAVSGSQVTKSNNESVASATLGGLANPRASATQKSRQELLEELLAE
jgi:predicted RNase H-like nuclease (RuvC/YqgF family)